MRTLRQANPGIPRPTAAEAIDQILEDVTPRILRHQRAQRLRAWWARYGGRFVIVPILLAAIVVGAWLYAGREGLVAGLMGTSIALAIMGLVVAFEGHEDRHLRRTPPPQTGGWIQ